jgi:hypothetical protein
MTSAKKGGQTGQTGHGFLRPCVIPYLIRRNPTVAASSQPNPGSPAGPGSPASPVLACWGGSPLLACRGGSPVLACWSGSLGSTASPTVRETANLRLQPKSGERRRVPPFLQSDIEATAALATQAKSDRYCEPEDDSRLEDVRAQSSPPHPASPARTCPARPPVGARPCGRRPGAGG